MFWKRSKSDLEQRMDAIESQVRLLRAEWIDQQDKMLHALDRNNKRRKQLVLENAPQNGDSADDLSSMGAIYARARSLGLVG